MCILDAGDMQFFSYPRIALVASAVTFVACTGQVADTEAERSGEGSGRFLSNLNAPVNATLYSQQQAAVETIADKAVANLSKLVPCDPKAMGDDACGAAFVSAFGKRAFRRP